MSDTSSCTIAPDTSDQQKTVSAIERRIWVRLPSNLDAICWLVDGSETAPWTAIVKDISVGGVGLISRRHIPQGTFIQLELQSNYVSLTGKLDAQAMFVKAWRENEWMIGCRFLKELGAEERRALL